MKLDSIVEIQNASLLKNVKQYKKAAREIQNYLTKHPNEWGKYQGIFNNEVNGVFRDIMEFERERLAKGDEASVYKLKRLFVNHVRRTILHLAPDLDHVFAADGLGLVPGFLRVGRVENHLRHPVSIAQVDEDHAPVIPDRIHPTAEGNFFAHRAGVQFTTSMCA